jgi:biopolymer transport protein ExbB/biopolymer transport protein TolQ
MDRGFNADVAADGIRGEGRGVRLFFMSMWSFGVAIERIFTYTQARNQSKLYAPQVAKHLKEGRLKDAIALSSSKNYRYSHLAKVVLGGLQEYQFQQESGSSLTREDLMDTVRRSIQRASALTASDLKKGVSALATIGSTAPFVGLLGTVVGVINAFQGIGASGSAGIGAVSVGISEALVETALGLVVAIPAVWFYNYLTGRIEYFNVEMDNSSSELVDYFIKKTAYRDLVRNRNSCTGRDSYVNGRRRRQRWSQGRYQRDAARGRHAGAAHHHDARRPDVAAGRQRQAADRYQHGRQARSQGQTVVAIGRDKSMYLNAKPVQEAIWRPRSTSCSKTPRRRSSSSRLTRRSNTGR